MLELGVELVEHGIIMISLFTTLISDLSEDRTDIGVIGPHQQLSVIDILVNRDRLVRVRKGGIRFDESVDWKLNVVAEGRSG